MENTGLIGVDIRMVKFDCESVVTTKKVSASIFLHFVSTNTKLLKFLALIEVLIFADFRCSVCLGHYLRH
jgi:hypothetical protein